MMVGNEEHPENFVSVSVDDYQRLAGMEAVIADVLLCLESTSDTIETLRSISMDLLRSQKDNSAVDYSVPPLGSPALDMAFVKEERQVSYTRKKAEALLSKIKNTRELVRLQQRFLSYHTKDMLLDLLSPRATKWLQSRLANGSTSKAGKAGAT